MKWTSFRKFLEKNARKSQFMTHKRVQNIKSSEKIIEKILKYINGNSVSTQDNPGFEPKVFAIIQLGFINSAVSIKTLVQLLNFNIMKSNKATLQFHSANFHTKNYCPKSQFEILKYSHRITDKNKFKPINSKPPKNKTNKNHLFAIS